MATVRDIARQVVEALPNDADFTDLDEFLFERAMVETGRTDFELGRTRRAEDLLQTAGETRLHALWSEHAAKAFLEALKTSHSGSPDDTRVFATAVAEAYVAFPTQGSISLPEMGDPTIREVPVRTPRLPYRLLYDLVDGVLRVLCFTNNVTCYRNARGRAAP